MQVCEHAQMPALTERVGTPRLRVGGAPGAWGRSGKGNEGVTGSENRQFAVQNRTDQPDYGSVSQAQEGLRVHSPEFAS